MSKNFVHLHCHSDYSLYDGMQKVDKMVERAAELGFPGIALTDHGKVGGLIKLYKNCKKNNINPIFGCLIAGQEIITENGISEIQNINVGDKVLTHTGKFQRVLSVMKKKVDTRLYYIELSGRYGRTLRLTEEHPILIFDGEKTQWKKPNEIEVGYKNKNSKRNKWNSYVCFPRIIGQEDYIPLDWAKYTSSKFSISKNTAKKNHLVKCESDREWEFPDIIFDEDFSLLLGWFCSEGWTTESGSVGFSLSSNEEHYILMIKYLLKKIFNVEATIENREDKNSIEIHFQNIFIATMLRNLCGYDSSSKKIPNEVLTSKTLVQNAYKEGLLRGDGKQFRKTNEKMERNLRTKSKNLAWGFKVLVANLGHWVGISESYEKFKKHKIYSILYKDIKKFDYIEKDEKFLYKPISKIFSHAYKGEVFNMEVENDNSYVSDFVLHNCEIYYLDDIQNKKGKQYHQTILAKNQKGYENLLALNTNSHQNLYRGFPRVDWNMLKEYHEGLIVTSGCTSSKMSHLCIEGDIDGARELAKKSKELWGDDYYFEVMLTGYEPQEQVVKVLSSLSKELGIKIVATNDVHYTYQDEAEHQKTKISISRSGPLPPDYDNKPFYYMKSYEEMLSVFPDNPEWIHNTLEINDKCNVELNLGGAKLPEFNVPNDDEDFNEFKKTLWNRGDEESYLIYLSFQGLKEKGLAEKDAYIIRLQQELETIRFTGFTSYFLIVWEYCNWARQQNIKIGAGRGCFLPDNSVITNNGNKKIQDIKLGDEVLSHDENYHEVLGLHQYMVDEEIIEIEMEDGRLISCTLDHKILVERNSEKIWVEAQHLTSDDEIVDLK